MTTRLVCLMSLLLLVALAVFGLLVQHSQDRIMEELEKTVSTVGRGTLQSLGPRGVTHSSTHLRGEYTEVSSFTVVSPSPTDSIADQPPPKTLEDAWGEIAPGQPIPAILSQLTEHPTSSPEAEVSDRPVEAEHRRVNVVLKDSVHGESGQVRMIAVSLPEVRAVSKQRQLLLRIPTLEVVREASDSGGPATTKSSIEDSSAWPGILTEIDPEKLETRWETRLDRSSDERPGVSFFCTLEPSSGGWLSVDAGTTPFATRFAESSVTFEPVVGDPNGAGIFRMEGLPSTALAPGEARAAEIVLGVPVATYEDIFSRMRQQSMLIFLVVLVVGVLLAIALAKRFLKPVRELDRALSLLSDGDWSARVQIRGRDEMARLGRAFNRMTRRVRDSRERELEMRRREKLSALGRLAAGVAHDVRNPLHSVNLTLQHLEEVCRPEASETRADFDRTVGLMRGEIRRLDGLIENFLRFARSEPRGRQRVRPETPLLEVARLLEKEAQRRGIRLETQVDEGLPEIEADLEGLRSAVLNLALNSFDAIPRRGGTVTLALRREGHEMVYEIVDTGQGIPEADYDRIFDFGYSTRETGTGLGLAMVHHVVVEVHGGRIQLASKVGSGSRFRLRLPMEDPGPVPGARKEVA